MLLDLFKTKKTANNKLATGDGMFGISDDFIRQLNSSVPISIIEPNLVFKQARDFVSEFPGETMYAI